MNTRRRFLVQAPLLAAAASARAADTPPGTAGAPPTWATAPGVGPDVTPQTFAEAGKLMQVSMKPAELAQAASAWRNTMAPLMERRSGPKHVALPDSVAPATLWQPLQFAPRANVGVERFKRSPDAHRPLPASDADIAHAPVTQLSRWIAARQLTSERLTKIYLDRIGRLDGRLRSIITLNADAALAAALAADAEIRRGHYRGPLHGIPFGVKDLLDTAGLATTWGAEPYRHRVPEHDAVVVARLKAAGAVLLAKLSLGALALNDVWFGGQTMNPWCLDEGASGSSAGPGAATAAALVGFSIGSETGGSIVSPSMRCGVTGLRPTFGRVARTGAMTLAWTLDKLGPMTRSVEDAMLVLQAISGPDAGDPYSVPSTVSFDAGASVRGLKLGYFPAWMNEDPATPVDRTALEHLRALGLQPTPVSLPDWPYGTLDTVIFAEAGASFEELTLSGGVDQLKMQVIDAWPNIFRQSRFLSAVDFVQADRLRRRVAGEMARIMNEVDVLLVPSLRGEMLTISNHTGHPSLTLRTGFVEVGEARSDWAPDPANPLPKFNPPRRVPHGVTLIGRLFDEARLAQVGAALERAAGVVAERPPNFA
ncbi:MAG: amidase [Paucibacter sp.]|nr:amidase [Roseateles sp.]